MIGRRKKAKQAVLTPAVERTDFDTRGRREQSAPLREPWPRPVEPATPSLPPTPPGADSCRPAMPHPCSRASPWRSIFL